MKKQEIMEALWPHSTIFTSQRHLGVLEQKGPKGKQNTFQDSFGASEVGQHLKTFPWTKFGFLYTIGKLEESRFTWDKNQSNTVCHLEDTSRRVKTCWTWACTAPETLWVTSSTYPLEWVVESATAPTRLVHSTDWSSCTFTLFPFKLGICIISLLSPGIKAPD